jgi:hypothetical protein
VFLGRFSFDAAELVAGARIEDLEELLKHQLLQLAAIWPDAALHAVRLDPR